MPIHTVSCPICDSESIALDGVELYCLDCGYLWCELEAPVEDTWVDDCDVCGGSAVGDCLFC